MITVLFAILSIFLLPSFAHAGEEGFFTLNLLWSIINFVILVAGFVYLYKKFHGEKFFKTRKENIEKLISEAMDLKQKAMDRHGDAEKQLSQFDKINKEITDDMNARAEKEKQAIVDEGGLMIKRLKQEGERISDTEIQKAKEMITDHIKSQLYELSKQYIEGSIDDNAQHNVTDKFIGKVQ